MNNERYALENNKGSNEAIKIVIFHVIITLLTGGLYYYFWAYQTIKFMNQEEDRTSSILFEVLILCIFPPYMWFWSYFIAKRFKEIAPKHGIKVFDGFEILNVVLSVILPFFNFVFLDYYLEKYKESEVVIEDEENIENEDTEFSTVQEFFEPDEEQPVVIKKIEPHVGIVDEMKKYKKFHDRGAMTDEEFENKKKELLDL